MYYQSNMQIMKTCRNALYNLIMKKETSEKTDKIIVTSIPTKMKEQALEVISGNHKLRLNSCYNPVQEARRWAQQHRARHLDTVAVMFGLGNGIFLRELLKRINKDNYVIVYEPSYTIFRHILGNYPMEDILSDQRILIIVEGENDYEFTYAISRTLSWMNLYSLLECFHPGYDKLFPESYQSFRGVLQDNRLDNLVAKNTNNKFGKLIAANAIHNIKYLRDSISFWDLHKVLPKDVPVIIVSAGPSLQKNVDLLKEAKGKSIIISVDRAYGILLAHDIEPDFVIHLDSKKALSSCGGRPGFQIPLLCKLEGSQQIMDNHRGKKIIYDCSGFIRNIYQICGKNMEAAAIGASVTTAAFALCALARFERIVLIGSDLAYIDGLSHAGMNYLPQWNNGLIELYVEDIHGEKIKTRFDWYAFLKWMEGVILQMPEIDIIDATEGGARIKGTRLMTLREVIDQYCDKKVDCEEIINRMEPTFQKEDALALTEYLKEGKSDLIEMRDTARKVLYDCDKLITNARMNKSSSSESQRLLKNLYAVNKRLEEKPIFSIVNDYVLGCNSDDIEEIYFMQEDKNKNELVSYETTKKVYKNIIEACEVFLPDLEKVIENI